MQNVVYLGGVLTQKQHPYMDLGAGLFGKLQSLNP